MRLMLLFVLFATFMQSQERGILRAEAAADLPTPKIGPYEVVVAKALPEENSIFDPLATTTVVSYSNRPIRVASAVKQPLTFQASAPVTLLEAITRAGGLTPAAGSEILVSTTQAAPGGQPASPMRRISVKALIDGTDPETNLHLSGGEEVSVPQAGRVFIVGNVNRPGAFRMEDGAAISVLRMLALARGLAPFAGNRAYIYRTNSDGRKNEIPIEISKILEGRVPDASLLANDVLYIPDNRNHRLGLAAVEELLLFSGTAGETDLIYGTR
jgi:polysaccharide biosynthesis/export protein